MAMAEIHDLISRVGREQALQLAGSDDDRRRIEKAASVMAKEDPNKWYLDAGLCMVALPHSKPKTTTSEHVLRNGRFTLILRPAPIGVKDEPDGTHEVEYSGLPYGPKARLILMYLQTYAHRHKTRRVVLGDSMSEWFRRLGLQVTGGEKGTINAVQEQAQRIARCAFTFIEASQDGNTKRVNDQNMAEGLELFAEEGDFDDDPAQGQLELGGGPPNVAALPARRKRKFNWVREIELTQAFYDHLLENKVVLREDAISRLKGSSWSLDAYTWLAYRLRYVDKPTTLRWGLLKDQFGGGPISNPRMFRPILTAALKDAIAVYPEADISIDDEGVTLRPSPPPVMSDFHVVRTIGGRSVGGR